MDCSSDRCGNNPFHAWLQRPHHRPADLLAQGCEAACTKGTGLPAAGKTACAVEGPDA
ncbi:MAG: hypothetical protein ACK55D_07510 [Synechococcaceae cyanobacterium]